MKKMTIKALCLVCCVSLLLAVCCSCGKAESAQKRKPYIVGTTSNVESAQGIAENDKFRLDWDAETANVLITDKTTGYIYSQIPYEYYTQNRDALKIANNNFMPGTPVPEVTTDNANLNIYSPLFITALGLTDNATTTYYSNVDVFKRGRVGSKTIENGIRVTYYFDALMISVPVDYTITEQGFNVQVVPTDIVEGDDENRILTVSLSPMINAVKNSADSYLVVPSGSGALMYTDVRGDGTARTFSGEVYGTDPAVELYEKLSNSEEVRLPVFGTVEGDRAVMAIIENGSEKCVINAQAGSKNLGLSSAYVTCYVRGYNRPVSTILAGRIRIRTHIKDNLTASEPITVSYHVLSGEKANYTGMANYYSEWLVKNKGMSESAESRLLYTQIVGGFQSNELFLGIPYKKTKSLTTYEQAGEIASALAEMVGDNMLVNMVGYGSTGVAYGKVGGGYTLTGASGNKSSLKDFNKLCEELGIDTYYNFDIVRFLSSAKGLGNTAVTANNAASKQYKYNISTRLREMDDYHFLLQRAELDDAAEVLLKTADKYGINNIALDSFGSIAYSDYVDEKYFNKEGTQEQYSEIAEQVKKDNKLLLNEANEYAAVTADVILDVPTGSNMDVSIDMDIPFYQIVFKGYVEFANSSINLALNDRTQFLKAIETGTGLSFMLTGEYSADTTLVGETVFYATLFEDNKETIASLLDESKEYLESVKSAKITAHSNLSAKVTKTVFSNGVGVIVNYGDSAVTVENVKVPAKGFTVLEKGGEVIG